MGESLEQNPSPAPRFGKGSQNRGIWFRRSLQAAVVIAVILLISTELHAIRSRTDYFLKPQAGLWFGPITPVYTTADDLDTSIGAGVFIRYNTPLREIKIGIDSSYQNFGSKGVNGLLFVPVYGSILFLLPFNLPVKLQMKAGAGSAYVSIKPDNSSQWDPLFTAGVEMSFPAGRIVNIGLRIDYHLVYEGYADHAKKNGHIVNAGISLYFNINI